MSLPCVSPPPRPQPGAEVAPEMAERILIVDDTRVNLSLLRAILRTRGYDLIEATDGEQAVQQAIEGHPDLILLDVMMPIKDGFEVCSELKARSDTVDIPIIFLTSLDDSADKIHGLELGAADYVTKPFDKGEVLARVDTQLGLRRLNLQLVQANQELSEKTERLEESLRAGSEIQKALLPQSKLEFAGLCVAWRFVPCDAIGGDIFNLVTLPHDMVAFYMADVSGHGVPSALLTVSISQSLSPLANVVTHRLGADSKLTVSRPAAVLESLDDEYPIERFDKHFTMSYLTLEMTSGRLRHSNAAHPPPILLRANGDLDFLHEGGSVVGIGGLVPFEEGETVFAAGDRLILYTDGIVELNNEDDELYGEERFYELIAKLADRDLEGLCDGVMDALHEFGGAAAPRDDISLLTIERLASPRVTA